MLLTSTRMPFAAVEIVAPANPSPVRRIWTGLREWRTHQFGGSTFVTDGAAYEEVASRKTRARSMDLQNCIRAGRIRRTPSPARSGAARERVSCPLAMRPGVLRRVVDPASHAGRPTR